MKRKSLLYKTGVEYGDYTMNHIQGCAHGCKYPCYAFMMKKRFGIVRDYKEWCSPVIVENTLELLDKEIPKLKNDIDNVQLSFMTDPFMNGYNEISKLSMDSIRKLNDAGIKCTVLTKGELPFSLSEFSKDNMYGITLVSLDEDFRKEYEPNTVDYDKRINALKKLKEAGCNTWVSIEPYPTPNIINQDLRELLDEISFVDRIVFGRMNYNKKVTEYKDHIDYYNTQADIVVEFCKKHNIDCHIKKGTIRQKKHSEK